MNNQNRAKVLCRCQVEPIEDNLNKGLVGYRVECKKCKEAAYVVYSEDDRWWVRMLQNLETYEVKTSKEFRRYRLDKWVDYFLKQLSWIVLKDERARLVLSGFLSVLFIVVLLFLLKLTPRWSFYVISIVLVVPQLIFILTNTIIVMVSDAFVTRLQRNLLRTSIFWLFNFFQVVMIFGCFYDLVLYSRNILENIYSSFATITTLGDSNLQLNFAINLLVILEVMTGFLFLVGILGIYITDFSRIPQHRLSMNDLRSESNRLDGQGYDLPLKKCTQRRVGSPGKA